MALERWCSLSRVKKDPYTCVSEELKNLTARNVISALVKAFVSCYSLYREESKGAGYIPWFSRTASEKLSESFTCDKAKPLLEQSSKYLDTLLSELSTIFDAIFTISLMLVSRLAIYTRNPLMPLEIAIAWDPLLNLPYIPASSLKGTARAWLELNNYKSIEGVDLDDIFGSSTREKAHISLAIFTDAYPVSCLNRLVEPDVITPHYSGDNIAEVDVNPTPLVFPTIAPGVTMKFILALNYSLDKDKELLNTAKAVKIAEHIVKALEGGIGTKTSIGYGRAKPAIIKSTIK
jgi:CRISPR-associated protein Cmr6